ncbi:MAG TPA: DedA family protein [Gaiellaceae bacterium]|nr:DedA family protein [Gaiellaceae bacterium]
MTSFLAHYGVVAVFVLMAIDAVFPAASELVMVYGGALASGALTHRVDVLGAHTSGFGAYVAVVAAGLLGYQCGAIGGWTIGDRGGRPLLERRGRWFHLTPERLDRADRWFERWDDRAVLVGRVTPVARSFISIPAGVFEMPFARYNLLTLAGNAVWCLSLAGIGWGVGTGYKSFDHGFRYAEYAVVAGIVALATYLVVRRRSSKQARATI